MKNKSNLNELRDKGELVLLFKHIFENIFENTHIRLCFNENTHIRYEIYEFTLIISEYSRMHIKNMYYSRIFENI